jgi:hypothetical protein
MIRYLRTVLLAFAIAAIAASLAGASPPSGQVAVVTAKGTTSEAFKLTTPQEVTVTQKYKVKVRVKGKLVTRTKTRQVKKTVDTPFVSCGATACDVIVQTITYQPGGFSGWHHHPGVVFAVVKSGQITRFKGGDCSKSTFTAGQTFVEMGEHDLVYVKNEGSTPTEIQVTLVHPTGAAPRAEEDAPANCNP